MVTAWCYVAPPSGTGVWDWGAQRVAQTPHSVGERTPAAGMSLGSQLPRVGVGPAHWLPLGVAPPSHPSL